MRTAFILLAALFAGSASAQKISWIPSSDKGFDQAMEEGRYVLQFFVKPKCAECALVERTVFKDPDVVDYIADRFVSIRCDQATPKGRLDAENYGIDNFPSILFYNSRGELIEHATLTGNVEPNDFLKHILNVTTGKFEQPSSSTSQIQATGQAVKAEPARATAWSKPDTTTTIVPPPLPDTAAKTAP